MKQYIMTCPKCEKEIEPKRLGRAHYHCPKCNEDITMFIICLEECKRNN